MIMDLPEFIDSLKNTPPRSTRNQLLEFKKSVIWQDISDTLNIWLVDSWEHLEREDAPELRGRIRCIREMLQIVDVLTPEDKD